jgi:hypothetical protein
MLEMAQTFLANKTARKFLFIYMLIMHFLVFITIYRSILVYSACHERKGGEPESEMLLYGGMYVCDVCIMFVEVYACNCMHATVHPSTV